MTAPTLRPGRQGLAPTSPPASASAAASPDPGRRRAASPPVDEALVGRAQHGDLAARDQLAAQIRPLVQRYAQRFVRDPARAEDLAQTVLMKAFTRLRDVRAPEAFLAWLLRITRNECLNELSRQRAHHVPLAELEAHGAAPATTLVADDPEESLMRTQLGACVRRVAEGLPEHYRRTLVMRALEDRSYEEISQRLDVPVPVARLWYCRARKRFRTAFVEAMVTRRDVPARCQEMGSAIAEMIEGSLARPDRVRLQGHLAECGVCRQTEDELRNTAFHAPSRAWLLGLGLLRLPLRTRRALQPALHSAAGAGKAALVAGVGGAAAVSGSAGTAAALGGGAVPAPALMAGAAIPASQAPARLPVQPLAGPAGAAAGSGAAAPVPASAGLLGSAGLPPGSAGPALVSAGLALGSAGLVLGGASVGALLDGVPQPHLGGIAVGTGSILGLGGVATTGALPAGVALPPVGTSLVGLVASAVSAAGAVAAPGSGVANALPTLPRPGANLPTATPTPAPGSAPGGLPLPLPSPGLPQLPAPPPPIPHAAA